MRQTYLEYTEKYNLMTSEEKLAHKNELTEVISALKAPAGNYPTVFALMLADNPDYAPLLEGNTEMLNDESFKKKLCDDYMDTVYAYRKRMGVICDLCLEDYKVQPKFCGNFTSFDNLDAIAELLSVSFGVLRRLQKTSTERKPIAKLRSCAVKLKMPMDELYSMIEDASK